MNGAGGPQIPSALSSAHSSGKPWSASAAPASTSTASSGGTPTAASGSPVAPAVGTSGRFGWAPQEDKTRKRTIQRHAGCIGSSLVTTTGAIPTAGEYIPAACLRAVVPGRPGLAPLTPL